MKKRMISFLIIVALLAVTGLPACAAAEAAGFIDVSADAWYAEAVAYCNENGLMSGTAATAFEPDATTTRAMLVSILYRQSGNPETQRNNDFSDVSAGAWYSGAVAWAAENRIVNGYENGAFGSNDPVTREQLAAILWRHVGSPTPDGGTSFADQSSIADYAIDAVAWAQEQGIVGGKDGNRFDPKGMATRAELAAILYRWLETDSSLSSGGPAGNGKVLVAYFSRTGNTQNVAETIAERTGGDLFEIVTAEAYPEEYDAVLSQAQQELRADARPALSSHVENLEQYDVIYLGFPIWHGDTPMPIRTFLEEYDLSGKTIAPFSTSGSSGISTAVAAIRSLCPDSNVTDGLSITSANLDNAGQLAAEWIDGLQLESGSDTLNRGPNAASAGEPGKNQGQIAALNLSIEVGNRTFTATLEDNETTRALAGYLPMTVSMGELNGNEKFYYMPDRLPTKAEKPDSIHIGDLMLYGSDCIVLFYQDLSNSYSYTRLGRVDNVSGLASALGQNDVEVTFRAD